MTPPPISQSSSTVFHGGRRQDAHAAVPPRDSADAAEPGSLPGQLLGAVHRLPAPVVPRALPQAELPQLPTEPVKATLDALPSLQESHLKRWQNILRMYSKRLRQEIHPPRRQRKSTLVLALPRRALQVQCLLQGLPKAN